MFKTIKYIISYLVLGILGLQIVGIMLLNIPAVQQKVGSVVSGELGKLLNTQVSIKSVDLGIFDQIILKDVRVLDQKQKPMLHVDKIAASIELTPLLHGQITIHTGQIFKLKARLYKETEKSPDNFQFVVDALSSKEENKEPSKINLQINSFILRDGDISYDRLYAPQKPGFDADHLKLSDLNAHIALKKLTNDSINVRIREFRFQEQSGLMLQNLILQFTANKRKAELRNFLLELPQSTLKIDSFDVWYNLNKKTALKDIEAGGVLKDSHITPSDLSALIPQLNRFDESVNLSFEFHQKGNTVNAQKINLSTTGNYILLQADAQAILPDKERPVRLHADIQKLEIQPTGYPFIFNNLNLGSCPAVLTRLGKTHFDGQIDTDTRAAKVDGKITTAVGELAVHTNMDTDRNIKGQLLSQNFSLGKLLAEENLGETSFDVDVDGSLAQNNPTGKVIGHINYLDFKNYHYQNVMVDAIYDGKDLDGHFRINDDNCLAEISGKAKLEGNTPSYDVQVNMKQVDLADLGLSKDSVSYQGKIIARLTGKKFDDLLGSIKLQGFQMEKPENTYGLDSLVIRATETDGRRTLELNSDFLHAQIEGIYRYTTLPQSFIKICHRYLPSLIGKDAQSDLGNNFKITATLSDATPLQQFLNLPLELQENLTVEGEVNDLENLLSLYLASGSFNYDNQHYELAQISCLGNQEEMTSSIEVNRFNKDKPLKLAVQARAKDDHLYTDVSWDNFQKTEKFAGTLKTRTHFQQEFNGPMNVNVSILPSDITLNDSTWQIRPSMIDCRDKKILISQLNVEGDDKYLKVNGIVSGDPTDTLRADLKDINLEYLFNALNFHPVELSGIATGKAVASGLLNNIDFDASIFVRDFKFEHGLLGNMNLHGRWDQDYEGIYLNGYISEFASDSNDSLAVWQAFRHETDASALTHVEGVVSPKNKVLNLHIDAEKTNLEFLESYIGSIFTDIDGRASGWARVSGTFKNIDLTANLKASLRAKVISLNTYYNIESDSIQLKTNRMEFHDLHLTDKEGHTGSAFGTVEHYYLHDMKYSFNITSNNLLCYDTRSFDEDVFYATAYCSGNVNIKGQGNVLQVNGDLETNAGTIVAYNASTPEDITNTQFITFVDKTPYSPNFSVVPLGNTTQQEEKEEEEDDDEPMNIYINLNMNCTPDATIRVLMDNVSGDDVTCHGNGYLQAEYFNKGAFKMYGIYNIARGVYKMSLQEVIRKEFNLNSGTVTFNGKPFDGQLDVKAVYTVNSASLRDLSPSTTFSQKSTTRVNCIMNLTGNLLKPAINFDLELPNVTDEDQAMVRSLVATEDQMNRQIIYLLGIGRFYTDEYGQDSNQTNQAMNSLLTSTISGQFNNILSQVANNNNWNFGANLNPGQDGLSNMEFQTMLSGSLFNDRLLINGNFGYRENALANTNFVGDFDLQWLLNKSGTISLKAYNETNDRYFTKNTLTTQGIGILFKREFQTWRDFFRKKKTRPARRDSTQGKQAEEGLKSEFVEFNR